MRTTTTRRRSLPAVTLLVLLPLVAVACADDGESDTATDTVDDIAGDDASGGELEGDFLVSGSSTVFPIVQKQAEEFGAVETGVAIAVEGPGSGDGAQKFCNGEVPIANASRLYKDEEIAICEENGIDFIEIRRGIDGISVITSTENDAFECVSFNDIYAVVSEEAFEFDSWADANTLTSEWGGTQFPEAPLDVFGPGEESGTFDSFGEIVIESVATGKTGLDPESRDFVTTIRPDYSSNPDDNIIVDGVSSSAYSIGWVGYAYARDAAAGGSVQLLAVSKEDGGDCVLPTAETIADASFPIARFLYTYVNAAAAQDPAVAAFVDYMMSDTGLESVSAVGYIDLSSADQSLAQAIWENRTSGRSWG